MTEKAMKLLKNGNQIEQQCILIKCTDLEVTHNGLAEHE